MRLAMFLILLSCTSMLLADSGTSAAESARLKFAKARHDQTVRQAETVYLKAKLAADTGYLKDAKTAMSDATKAGNLDEATDIKSVVKALESEIETTQLRLAGAQRFIVKISASKGWQQALEVKKGNVLAVTAEGKWCMNTHKRDIDTSDANGKPNSKNNEFGVDAPFCSLIGQIGDKTFLVGRSATIHAEQDGALELRMNDSGVGDNDGELTVTIYLKL